MMSSSRKSAKFDLRLQFALQHNKTKQTRTGKLDIQAENEVFQAIGCERCNQTGYRGRVGIYELIKIDYTLRQLIHDGAGEQAILQHARQFSDSLLADGRRRILAGETSLEEVLRVTVIS